MGWVLAHNLARRGYALVLPCRSLNKAESLRTSILLHSAGAILDFVPCDLADLSSVQRCARTIAERHPVIDLVIANAASVAREKTLSAQGVELTFAVNHLAHYVLVQWLAANLYTHSRVILVASSGARWGNPGFIDDIENRRCRYGMFRAYANSKLANIACAEKLAVQFDGRQIACMSVHPGMLDTAIWPRHSLWHKLVLPLLKQIYLASPERGANIVEHLAVAPEHNESCGYYDVSGKVSPPKSVSGEFADKLWALSSHLSRDFLPV